MPKVFIIAEAGVNHNGDLKLAKKLVDIAVRAGVDAVKFQTFVADELLVPDAPKAGYQKRQAPGQSQYEMIKGLELSKSDFSELFKYCKRKNKMFLSTPFDPESAAFLFKLGVRMFKIGSGEITNLPLLEQIAKYGKPMILSTGMSDLAEIGQAIKTIKKVGNRKLTLLHCTSNYPADFRDVHLKAMQTLKDKFKLPVGYSDHTLGIEVAVAAAALGAQVIEKHFTLDKNLPGPDHRASLDPGELRNMVRSIRNIEKALGGGEKKLQRSERDVRKAVRKSIVAAGLIPKGAKVTANLLKIKRPGTGIEPRYLDRVVGKTAKVNIRKDQVIAWREIQ